jgi:hypothetical protein
MKFSKKILATVLAALMAISMMPFTAFATEWTDQDVWGYDLQTGDILSSDVEEVHGLEEYTLTLQAGGYGDDFDVADSDLVTTSWQFDWTEAPWGGNTLRIFDYSNDYQVYYPYNANGTTNQWYVVDVDHENQTITLSGSDASDADEVSETISLAYAPLSTISGTHYTVSADNLVGESSLTINDMHPMTINARKGETITKVVLTYRTGDDKDTLSASAGTFDGDATFSNINAQQVTISSWENVDISGVTVYFEGDLDNPTVTLTGGANTKSSGGLSTQSYLPGAMDTVTYTALADATFPEFETYTLNGVTVERTSDTVVTVSGTPTANTAITVPDAESSSIIVTWNATLLNDYIADEISDGNGYSDTANGITLTTSEGEVDYFGNSYLETYDGTTLNFSTTAGKFTSIEIEANSIYDGGNWTKDGNILKWNGTPSESVSLTGDVFIMGLSSITFVIEPAPSAYAGYVPAEADNADALAAKVVKFNGYDWYMIEDNSTSETEGTVTLLAADTSFGATQFNSSVYVNKYSTSTVKTYLDGMTETGGAFADVADAIVATDLTDVNVTGAKLWLLSSGEANNIPVNVRMCSQASEAIFNAWWLRSADSDGTIAEFVMGSNGYVANGGTGANVNQSFGVRPALKLDLSKVEFDSATNTFAPPAPAEPNNGASITVGETISENFYLDDEFYGETAYVAFTYNHNSDVSQTANVSTDVMAMSSLNESGDGRKVFSVTQAPAQATEPIEINIYANAEDAANKENAIDTIDYSVYTYCREVITGEYPDGLKEVAKTTLDYAAAAQTYFNYNTGDMATKDAENDFYNNVAGLDMSEVSAPVSAAPSCIKRVAVVVKSDLEINLLSNAPLTVESAGIAATKGTENFAVSTYQKDGYYVLHIAGIEAANMNKTITVETNEGNLVMTANSVIKMLAANGDTNLSTLAKAMYLYGAAASAYFN